MVLSCLLPTDEEVTLSEHGYDYELGCAPKLRCPGLILCQFIGVTDFVTDSVSSVCLLCERDWAELMSLASEFPAF